MALRTYGTMQVDWEKRADMEDEAKTILPSILLLPGQPWLLISHGETPAICFLPCEPASAQWCCDLPPPSRSLHLFPFPVLVPAVPDK